MRIYVTLIIVSTLFVTVSYAGNNNNNPQQTQEKKTEKPKYDFNLFKILSLPTPKVDSLKPIIEPEIKVTPTLSIYPTFTKKEEELTI